MLALAYGGYSPVKAEGKNYSDYVNPLMGTLSEHQLSTVTPIRPLPAPGE